MKESLTADQVAATMRKHIQRRCLHPLGKLEFRYAATSAYCGHMTTHSITVECTECGKMTVKDLVIREE